MNERVYQISEFRPPVSDTSDCYLETDGAGDIMLGKYDLSCEAPTLDMHVVLKLARISELKA